MKNFSRIWNSVELSKLYSDQGGTRSTKKQLLKDISNHFGESILVMSSPGIASIVVFRDEAPGLLKLVPDNDVNETDISISILKKEIVTEIKAKSSKKSTYDIRINKDTASEAASDTLLSLLAKISPKLENTLRAILIGNIVTGTLNNTPTALQIALGILLKDSKEIISQLHEFGVTCTYDEVLRFRKSAAAAASQEKALSGIVDKNVGMIQAVADNFDAEISSQNGKISTHSLALLLTQPQPQTATNKSENVTIPRLRKQDMHNPIEYDIDIQNFRGPKRPDVTINLSVPSLKTLCHIEISKRRARATDFAFFKDVIQSDLCPEYNGYNSKLCREQGHSLSVGTKAMYLPLIDMTPSNPDTMMTALIQAQKLVTEAGQDYLVFTCDQQLYRVSLQVMWSYPDQFSNVVLRLGGMHLLMTFVGAAFAGVPKMLNGKKFPQNVRALRLVAEELLRKVLQENPYMSTYDELEIWLKDAADKSRTAKLWTEMLIKPVFIMMLYIRAERESDWPLHLDAVQQMLPYFFASGHVNYARYGTYYLQSMQNLPPDVQEKFMKGLHVMHHNPGFWNGIWSDMYIETTFMRYGHSHGGIIGITLQPETLKTWALGLYIRSRLVEDIVHMTDPDCDAVQEKHKEEMRSRIKADAADRTVIREKVELSIDPFDAHTEANKIVNIVSGRVAPPAVNVDQAHDIGLQQMKRFEAALPNGFYDTISKKVITLEASKKHVKMGEKTIVNTELLFSRLLGLQGSCREFLDIKDLLTYELSPVPTAMFQGSGDMRISKSKSELKKQLQVDISTRKALESIECEVLDGSAILWVINWPSNGTVREYVTNVKKYLSKRLQKIDLYLVFDRYNDFSTKCAARSEREAEASRVHQLSLDTPLPSQKVVLTVSKNKKQIMELICDELVSDKEFHKHTSNHKLVITGNNDIPIEISNGGVLINRRDLTCSHEEADCIIVQQVITTAKDLNVGVSVIADDTDVFVLLLHHYYEQQLTVPMIMDSPVSGRTAIDIRSSVQQHSLILSDILAMHAISGCDTVACCFGIGKAKALKVLKTGYSLSCLGDENAQLTDISAQTSSFMSACYGIKNCNSLTIARQECWVAKVGTRRAIMPKLQSLPPTTEAFLENVKRAHLQTCVWKHALDSHPPLLDPKKHGYYVDSSRSLLPTTVPDEVCLAPDSILRMIRCSCHSDKPCNTARCGCTSVNLPCTIFCSCQASNCFNHLTEQDLQHENLEVADDD